MLTLIRRCSQIHSTAAVTSGALGNNTSSKMFSARQFTFAVNRHISELITTRSACQQKTGVQLRNLSTLENRSERLKILEDEKREFMAVYPDVVRDLTSIANRYNSKEAADWFKKAVEYNLSPTNAKNGLITVSTYKNLIDVNQRTTKNIRLAHLLGWCIELLHCVILIADDMVDNGTKRRGQLCWHRCAEVGPNAVNDGLMMENGIYELLYKHFRHLDCYADLADLFHQNTFNCICGQSLDVLVSKKNVTTFNMDTYNAVVMNKSSCHFFYLPVALGLHLAGVTDRGVFDECKAITIELGTFFQVQNDFLDCFGNPAATGKVGTDIQANKCSWLAVVCLELASPEQKAILEECYGKDDLQKTARVKQLYEEMNISSLYFKYEDEIYKKINTLIQRASDSVPRKVLFELLNIINQRDIK